MSRQIASLTILFCFFFCESYSQTSDSTFSYSDTTVTWNKSKTIRGFNFLKSDSVTEGAHWNNPQLLDSLIWFLKNNRNQKIELSFYIGCRIKNEDYNLKVSMHIVQSFKDYIVENGIDESRITVYGRGFSKPLINCMCGECSHDDYTTNRRLVIKTLK